MIDKTARRPVHTRKSRFYVQYSSHESVSTTCKISSEHWAVAAAAARAEDENFTIDTVLPAGSMIINNSIQDRKAISEQQIAETFNGLHRSLLCSKNILWLRFSSSLKLCVLRMVIWTWNFILLILDVVVYEHVHDEGRVLNKWGGWYGISRKRNSSLIKFLAVFLPGRCARVLGEIHFSSHRLAPFVWNENEKVKKKPKR